MSQVAGLPSIALPQATTWLQHNPAKAQDPQLVAAADRDASQDVDAVELSQAMQGGKVVLTGAESFAISRLNQPAAPVKKTAGPPIQAVLAVGSVIGGLSLAEKSPALGIGVMIGGLILSATVGLLKD